ncbi:MAG: DNA polymerase IV [Lachnospiraceae bacterium]
MPDPIIFHIDVNSAFLSWESCYRLQQDPDAVDLREIPAVVGGDQETRHGIVLAKSMAAKKFGIKTAEPLVSACKKCPNLTIVKPNFRVYVEYSNRFMELLKRYAPVVEQFSIDEAFCDMTGTQKLYGDMISFANFLRETIYKELGFTVNIGVSENKLLAKMASDFEKPNKVHSLFKSEIREKMWPLPVGELFSVGKSTRSGLQALGIRTIGDLAQTDPAILKSHFKSHGETIWNYANGNDMEMVTDHQQPNKGYGNSITVPSDVTDAETAKMILLSLTETVSARIRGDKTHISVVSVQLVDYEFHRSSKQMTLLSPTNITENIYRSVCTLFDQLWDGTPLRLLGVQTSKASANDALQYNLFDYQKNEKLEKLDSAIDKIRMKYGEDSIQRASFIGAKQKHMTGGLNKEKRSTQNK